MIKRLIIKNYAIIEEQEINFSDRLTIITGETGAGKSILLGALGLIMGKRADTKSLYDDAKKCIVEGVFEVSKYNLQAFFEIHDIDYDEEVVVRRELTPSGKSRSFVNDTPVNLKVLQKLSSSLIDLHQQFDTLDIHNISFQLRMIDALAENKSLLHEYQDEFKQYQADKKRLTKLIAQSQNAAKEVDFLSFQLKEFRETVLVEGEQDSLEGELNQLSNAEDIKRTLGTAFQHLSEAEQSLIGQLQQIGQSLISVRNFHPDIEHISDRYDGLVLELQDLVQDFEKIAEATEYDAARIQEIQERLDQIYKLQNKHQVKTVGELMDIQAELEQKLSGFADLSGEIAAIEQSLETRKSLLLKTAEQLSNKRKSVVSGFEDKVHELLGQLSMEHARLKVEVNKLEELNSTGYDEINFLFAPNMGSKFLPIKNVASGGEISRLTICTKSLVASAIPLPTLIFDEIDTGVSGDVALKMGNILHGLANKHQVVSITHTPQIAVKADTHYFVYKKVKGDRTVTNVRLLELEDRIKEVATMLSGNPPSDSAIKNARELLML